jgi:MYXO-CTERM domain-containing protein
LFAVVAAAILAAVALSVGYASQTAADPARWQTIAGVLGGAALMVLVLGILRRRR